MSKSIPDYGVSNTPPDPGRMYLAGPRCEGQYPYAWHRWVADTTSLSTINPFIETDASSVDADTVVEHDYLLVRSADVVLLRRIDSYNLCGASCEAEHARANGIPVIVWNDAETAVPLFLSGVATAVVDSRRGAVELAEYIHQLDVPLQQHLVTLTETAWESLGTQSSVTGQVITDTVDSVVASLDGLGDHATASLANLLCATVRDSTRTHIERGTGQQK